jgi:hypothetical protein
VAGQENGGDKSGEMVGVLQNIFFVLFFRDFKIASIKNKPTIGLNLSLWKLF